MTPARLNALADRCDDIVAREAANATATGYGLTGQSGAMQRAANAAAVSCALRARARAMEGE